MTISEGLQHHGRIAVAVLTLLTVGSEFADAQDGDVRDSLVYIRTTAQTATGIPVETHATGFFVGSAGNILTNYHIITQLGKNPQLGAVRPETIKFEVWLRSKDGPLIEHVDRVDDNPNQDMLLLDVDASVMGSPLCVAPDYQPTSTETLSSPGFPDNIRFAHPPGNIVSLEGDNGWWIVDIAFNEGQSGSPVLTDDGRVIGIAKGQNAVGPNREPVAGQYVVVPIGHAPGIETFGQAGCADAVGAEFEKFGRTVYLGASREAIINALGDPKIHVVDRNAPADLNLASSDDGEVYELTASEKAHLEAAFDRMSASTDLFRFENFVAEVVYLANSVVQYSAIATSNKPLDLNLLTDYLNVHPGGNLDSLLLGSFSFSELLCGDVDGTYYNRDSWVRMRCGYSGATGYIETSFFHSPFGSRFGDLSALPEMGKEIEEMPADKILSAHSPIGYFLLSSPTTWDVTCDPLPAIESLEDLEREARKLPILGEDAEREDPARVCFSLRIVSPNGVVVRDMSSDYESIPLANGETVYLSPGVISDGMITFDRYGPRRAALWR